MKAKRLLSLLLLALLLLPSAAPPQAAEASSGEKEVVIRTLHVPHFDAWLRADGVTWTGGRPGQTLTHPVLDILPAAIAQKYDLAAPPEVTTNITPELYAQTLSPDLQQRGWWGSSWEQFKASIYDYRPLEYFRASIPVTVDEINRSRSAMLVAEFKLSPYAPREEQEQKRFPDGLQYKYPVDLREIEERNGQRFQPKVEGWRWMLPVVVTWRLKERPKPPDLYVKSLDPGTSEVEEGKKYSGMVVYGLKATVSGSVRAKLELTHNGYPVPGVDGQVVEFSSGEEKSFTFSFTAQNRDSVLTAKIRPVEGDDADWSNNSKAVTLPLKREVRSQPGSLTFQAVSQTRTKVRPPGTAKWTDWVTARLVPPTPTPPRPDAWIEDWWIVSGTLTYPKKHPNFTIGCPYPPQGTRTIPMKVSADKKSATVEFQEDWALDGAPVYCLLEGRLMAETPRYYTITASYTVRYTYKYRSGTYPDGTPKYSTATKTTSGTITGKLLVNGTGVDSRAQ
jgi:hypothetical protein